MAHLLRAADILTLAMTHASSPTSHVIMIGSKARPLVSKLGFSFLSVAGGPQQL
jgi:hypothetical protein